MIKAMWLNERHLTLCAPRMMKHEAPRTTCDALLTGKRVQSESMNYWNTTENSVFWLYVSPSGLHSKDQKVKNLKSTKISETVLSSFLVIILVSLLKYGWKNNYANVISSQDVQLMKRKIIILNPTSKNSNLKFESEESVWMNLWFFSFLRDSIS